MKKIKSLLFVLLGVFALVSCSDDDTPTVSFSKNTYVLMPEQDLEVVVNLSEAPATDLEIPFVLGGSAEKDTDFTLSIEKLIVKAGEVSAKFTVSPKDNYEADKVIIINLGVVPGYDLGSNQVATIGVTPKEKILYTFDKEFSVLENTLDVYINIYNAEGEKIIPTKDIHIPFVIDENSTAEVGKSYSVDGDVTEFVIPAGKNQGKITLNYIENSEKDKNKLIIGIPELGVGFIKGGILKTTVNVYGASVSKLFGKWVGVKLANKDYLVNDAANYGVPKDAENLPENILNDTLVLEAGAVDMLKPIMKADGAKYFRETSIKYLGVEEFTYGEEWAPGKPAPKYNLFVFEQEKANVSFSSDNESLKKSKIAFRIKEVNDEEILEVTIYDFAPTDFYTAIYGMMGSMEWNPFRYQFKRVK